ncbi:MAG: FHA domain protein [Idiomarinaceae bacterium HL-53]|nr:MAG: FHA domain protein [Idiomarinaceae bacterium HL-53]CUS48998.1 FHA domain-containing protein [Idiomarinaceae bacterium HL-53]
MPMIMCAAGKHFYNPDIHDQCPSCKEDGVQADDIPSTSDFAAKTSVMSTPSSGTDATPKTTALNEPETAKTTVKRDVSQDMSPKTAMPPAKTPPPKSAEKVEPIISSTDFDDSESMPRIDSGSSLKTRVVMSKHESAGSAKSSSVTQADEFFPVVGWLVVVKGKGLGHDFRLIQGENRIGRGEEMEVCLDFGLDSDDTVSRDAHAIVVFDNNANEFFIERGNSRNLPMLNGATIRRDQNLNHGDVIQLGSTELRFISFCNQEFQW